MRVAICQTEPVLLDLKANIESVLQQINEYKEKGADLIVFPELALSGYPVWDLANKGDFIDKGLATLQKVKKLTRRMRTAVVVGFIDRRPGGEGN